MNTMGNFWIYAAVLLSDGAILSSYGRRGVSFWFHLEIKANLCSDAAGFMQCMDIFLMGCQMVLSFN